MGLSLSTKVAAIWFIFCLTFALNNMSTMRDGINYFICQHFAWIFEKYGCFSSK
jgi:hypothetical protein